MKILAISSFCLVVLLLPCGILALSASCVDGECAIPNSEVPKSLFENTISVHIFHNGGNNTGHQGVVLNTVRSSDPVFFDQFRKSAARALDYGNYTDLEEKNPDDGVRVRVFNRFGRLVSSTQELHDGDLLFLVPTQEWFVWPGLYIGYKVPLYDVTPAPELNITLELETLSLTPRIFRMTNFISAEEAQQLIDKAIPLMFRSKVYITEFEQPSTDARTSTQAWLFRTDNSIVERIDGRVAQLTHIPLEADLDEAMQVVHYDPGQHYHAHFDYFPVDTWREGARYDLHLGQNRFITVFYYLNDVEEGGETVFPRGGEDGYKDGEVIDYSTCGRGLRVKPAKGNAIMWYNLLAEDHYNAILDSYTLHGGCDVIKGEKWGANKWLVNKPKITGKHNE